ncbi:MAG: adenosylmethionine decarboxylase [Nitrososphaerales archaeon]
MGIHIIAELLGVDPEKISRVEIVRNIFDRVIYESNLKVISSNFYQFEPYGVSAVYLLRESHLSVHTWPEHGYIALDIFTCGSNKLAYKAFELLVKEFKPKIIKKKILKRNIYEQSQNANTL